MVDVPVGAGPGFNILLSVELFHQIGIGVHLFFKRQFSDAVVKSQREHINIGVERIRIAECIARIYAYYGSDVFCIRVNSGKGSVNKRANSAPGPIPWETAYCLQGS